jgi:hypothetical protein
MLKRNFWRHARIGPMLRRPARSERMFRIPRFLTRNPLFYRTRDLRVRGPLFNARRWICRPKDTICTSVQRLVQTRCAWHERVDNERDRELGRRSGVRIIATPCGQQGKGPAALRLAAAGQGLLTSSPAPPRGLTVLPDNAARAAPPGSHSNPLIRRRFFPQVDAAFGRVLIDLREFFL